MTIKKNVLHIIDSLGRGGAENLLINYVKELKDYNNYILYFHEPHDLKPQISNAQVICLKKTEKFNAVAIIWQIRKIIRNEKINIVHSHCYWSNIFTRFATPGNVKLINHYHFATYDTMKHQAKLRRRLWLDKITHNKRVNTIAVSDYVASILNKECGFQKKLVTIRNFIGDSFYKNKSNLREEWESGKKLKLIAIGSLKKEKNYELLIDAFKILKNYPVLLDVYGGGERLEWFRKETEINNISNLRFLGNHKNVQSLFSDYHGYVMCSFSEACPLSPLEAMCSGLPLILSDIPSLKEIASGNALFFQNKSADSFSELIQSIFSGDKQMTISEQGYNKVLGHYTKEHFMEQLIKIYEEK